MLTPFPSVYPAQETKDFLVVWTQRKYLASKYQPLHANRAISSFRLTTSFLHAKNNLPFTFFFSGLYTDYSENPQRGDQCKLPLNI